MKRVTLIALSLIFFVNGVNAKKPNGEAIASASPYATKAGMAIFKKGGNAFDAAVAVSAVLAVTEPFHSGIGGGGFWLLHDAKTNKNHFIDGRERAPARATADMYLDKSGKPIRYASLFGPKAAAVPGEPAALVYMAKHYGHLPLSVTLAPAIKLAREGYPVDHRYVELAREKPLLKVLRQYPASRQVFLDNGNAPEVGWVLKQNDLANTLESIAKHGKAGFYQGKVAKAMVKAVDSAGGIWRLSDLVSYHVVDRKPLVGHYNGIEIVTAPPPSAGGIALLSMLNILEKYPLDSLPNTKQLHLTIEAMRLAFWDRVQFLGDPDFTPVPVKKLLSAKHVSYLNRFIQKDKATPSVKLSKTKQQPSDVDANTTHFSIIDSQGNLVSATMSVNFLFGSGFVAGNTGVLLNDTMDDFAVKVGAKNVFGLSGETNNVIAAHKRPVSSMSPTFLFTDKRVGVLGTPGGSRIPTMVLLGTLSFADGRHPISWVSRPRFHHQFLPDVVQFENDAFTAKEKKALVAMGYQLKPLNSDYGSKTFNYGEMHAAEWDKANGALYAASDPRHAGLAIVNPHDY